MESIVELERGKSGLGFSILGGKDAPYLPWDDGIFISKVTDGGAAALDGRLQKGDKIIEINGESVAGLNHADVVDKFRKAKKAVCLKVIHGEEERLKNERKDDEKLNLEFPNDDDAGFPNYLKIGLAVSAVGIVTFIGLNFLRR